MGLPAGRLLGNRGHRGQRLADDGQHQLGDSGSQQAGVMLLPAAGQDHVIRARRCPSWDCHHPLGVDGTPWPLRVQAGQLLNELYAYQYEWPVATFGRFPLTQHFSFSPRANAAVRQKYVYACVCVCVCVCV